MHHPCRRRYFDLVFEPEKNKWPGWVGWTLKKERVWKLKMEVDGTWLSFSIGVIFR